ncbi:hypothetical protein J3R82DRAFT_2798 [Butyriboletus roseoflavus]|nr:hypothetical protein J3R82DRAFT_2798 [Butyriboletus roseoflavus]
MERTIGNLGQQIRQPSKPYANLAQEGVRHSQINALLSIIPELDSPPKVLPCGSIDLGDGYVLLHKWSKYPVSPDNALTQLLQNYIPVTQDIPHFDKWEDWSFADIAILKLYSEPDPELLWLSSQVLAASLLLDNLFICDVKSIRSVVAMIPRTLISPNGIETCFFCMMEKPGLDISDLGVPYSVYSEAGDDEDEEGDHADVE